MSYQANAGETVYSFLECVIEDLQCKGIQSSMATHNGVSIMVYKESCLTDVWEKYQMQRTIYQLEGRKY